jgi:1-acyl-sn-glycerol-3-phosphate acyltransferase
MHLMFDNTLVRRLVTIPMVYVLLVLTTVLSPLLVLAALAVDLVRRLRSGRPFMALRMLAFGWVYLLGEAWALVTMGLVGLFGRQRAVDMTFTLQRAWTGWNFWALRVFFSLDFEVTGSESIPPGPILLLSRHASMIDTMLPAAYVVRPHGIKLKYVLKKELLLDPALDIGGNRLPNYFVDRSSRASENERNAIRRLATDLKPDEGVLIYPEGTRYSEEKRVRYTDRLKSRPGRMGEVAAMLRRVLPPRPGGTLALLESSTADIVVLMHRGLEGFARAKDIWKGHLVGSKVVAHFLRVARTDIPDSRAERVDWLFDLWAKVDGWVVGEEALAEGT